MNEINVVKENGAWISSAIDIFFFCDWMHFVSIRLIVSQERISRGSVEGHEGAWQQDEGIKQCNK